MRDEARQIIQLFEDKNIKVVQREKMHQKIAIIDGHILWEGSLNILSHRDAGEHMRRIEGKSAVDEVVSLFELDDPSGIGDGVRKCKRCSDGVLVVRHGKYGKFLRCLKCPATEDVAGKRKRYKRYSKYK